MASSPWQDKCCRYHWLLCKSKLLIADTDGLLAFSSRNHNNEWQQQGMHNVNAFLAMDTWPSRYGLTVVGLFHASL